jgi:glycopeptide antibiotics resistance protein
MISGNFVWIAWPVVAAAVAYRPLRRRAGWPRVLAAVALATYALWICSVAFFPMPTPETVAAMAPGGLESMSWVNWVPFRELAPNLSQLTTPQIIREFGGNLLLFVPFTLFGPMFWQGLRTWRWPLVAGLGGSVAIELIQLCLSAVVGYPYRQTDVDDIILNTVSAFLGYGIYVAGVRFLRVVNRHA